METLLELVRQFFDADGWSYRLVEQKADQPANKRSSENEDRPSDTWDVQVSDFFVLQTWFSGDHGQFNCYVQERNEFRQLLVYSIFPVRVPDDKLSLAAEYITRANYALLSGNFELDYRSGRVRFKTSLDVYGETLTTGMVKQLIHANVYVMDRYLPGLMRVLFGDLPPHAAVAEIEYSPA
jgi:hypothetical protein